MFIPDKGSSIVRAKNDISIFGGTITKGSLLKVIGSGERGYDLENIESGVKVRETGLSFNEDFEIVERK